MKCKLIEEQLIDYIDGGLSVEEISLIKEHIENCPECEKEYEQFKSTINYITQKSKSIDTSKEINLNRDMNNRKSYKKFTRTGLMAIALSLILIVTAVATDMFGFMEYWKKSSEITENAWEKLIDNGIGQKLDISTTDKDIKITAEGVISDELNTIILLNVEDLKGNNKYVPTISSSEESYNYRPIILSGDIAPDDEFNQDTIISGQFTPIYSPMNGEQENSIKLMIWTNPINKNSGNINIEIELLDIFSHKPYQNTGNGISGQWNLTIPVEFIQSKTYEINKKMDLFGNELDIKEIVIAPSATNIKYGIKAFNDEKDYFLTNISFLIKNDGKEYERSELSFTPFNEERDPSYLLGEYRLQSLYLEDPKDLELVVNTYKANSKRPKTFNIDWDNLPQILDFKGSKITIESLEVESKKARIVIKEDMNKERKYIKSDISLKINHDKKFIEQGNKVMNVQSYYSGSNLDFELIDSRGKDLKYYDFFLPEEYYTYVRTQELTIEQEDFDWNNIEVGDYKALLKDAVFSIDGLNYKEFPGKSINIKLK